MIGVAMIVGFSFQGTELIGIAAGESKDPGKKYSKGNSQSVLAYSVVLYLRYSDY